MNFYEELLAEFSTATQCFKAGNHLLFFRDMTHNLSDLLYTKGSQCSHNDILCLTHSVSVIFNKICEICFNPFNASCPKLKGSAHTGLTHNY